MISHGHPALELKGLGVSFGQRVVLDGITLSLLPEGIDVLMGPVKVGKSTLLHTLAGTYQGHALHRSWGEAALDGSPLGEHNRPLLVQQHAKTVDMPLLQALLVHARTREQRSAGEWRELGLQWMSCHGLESYLAQADKPLLQCDSRLQRAVSILSHAMLKPVMLMIDEPTFGMSDTDAAWMVDWIKNLAPHCKLWVALHNQMHARRLADRIVLIGGGRVLAHQSTTHFFQRPANEQVEQFIRTGSLSLPAPDARVQDLADDVAAPPPLSLAAHEAIRPFLGGQHGVPKKSRVDAVSSSLQDGKVPVLKVVDNLHTFNPPEDENRLAVVPVSPATEARKPVDLPMPSRDGVALAAAVGDIIYRDSSAPRGFHWIVPGKLAGCPAPGVSAPIDYDLDLLAKTGITRLITLTETDLDQAALHKHHLMNLHLPIFDREAPSISQTHMLLVRMQKFIASGEVLAVHCKAGLGRTGTILAAWLIRDGGLTASDSMARLRRIEPGFIQSVAQEEFLHRYEADITQRLL